jgi:integrase
MCKMLNVTTADAAQTYLDAIAKHRRPATHRGASQHVERFRAFLGDKPLEALPRDVLGQYAETLQARRMSANSVRLFAGGALAWLRWLKREKGLEVAEVNPRPMAMPRKHRTHRRPLTPDELRAYGLAAIAKPWPVSVALILLPLSGLRAGELCAAKVGWLRGGVFLPGAITKNHRDRFVPIHPAASGAIGALAASRRVHDSLFGLAVRTLETHVASTSDAVGRSVFPHLLRHTFNDNLRRAGVSDFLRNRLMGHATSERNGVFLPAQINDLYSHEDPTELREAVARLDASWIP